MFQQLTNSHKKDMVIILTHLNCQLHSSRQRRCVGDLTSMFRFILDYVVMISFWLNLVRSAYMAFFKNLLIYLLRRILEKVFNDGVSQLFEVGRKLDLGQEGDEVAGVAGDHHYHKEPPGAYHEAAIAGVRFCPAAGWCRNDTTDTTPSVGFDVGRRLASAHHLRR